MESATDSAKREADRDTMAVEVERNRPTAAARRPPRILPAMFSKVTVPMRRFLGHHIFSSLTRRILFLNLAGLAVLVTGILYLNTFRDGLIDARVESLMTQGEIIAGAIAASATVETDAIRIDPEKLLELQAGESIGPSADQLDNLDFPINPERVAPVLRRLISPTRTRARIYDRDANLLLDSRHLYSKGQILRYDLPPVDEEEPSVAERAQKFIFDIFSNHSLPVYKEQPGGNGGAFPEVVKALTGSPSTIVRVSDRRLHQEAVLAASAGRARARRLAPHQRPRGRGQSPDAAVPLARARPARDGSGTPHLHLEGRAGDIDRHRVPHPAFAGTAAGRGEKP